MNKHFLYSIAIVGTLFSIASLLCEQPVLLPDEVLQAKEQTATKQKDAAANVKATSTNSPIKDTATKSHKKNKKASSTANAFNKVSHSKKAKKQDKETLSKVVQTQKPIEVSATKKHKKHSAVQPKGEVVDNIAVIIYGDESTQIITKSDFERPGIDGQMRSKDDIIMERLMFLDAGKMHMVQTDDAVDTYLNTIMRENNISKEQLEAMFAQSGYSYEEAREMLRIMYTVNGIVDFKIRSRLIVPEQDVVAYHKSHPILLQPTYNIQRAVIALPTDATEAAALQQQVQALCKEGKVEGLTPQWEEAFWVDKGDLAQDKMFITTMKVGACAISQQTDTSIELFKLVDKKDEREQSLEERYREIVEILRRPKYEELLAEYKKQLLQTASIVYL